MSDFSGIDPAFGNWLAGFIDGEGSFTIIKSPQRSGHHPRFSIEVRADEMPIIREIRERTGIGKIGVRHRDMAPLRASPHVTWDVGRINDTVRLAELLEIYPLRAKKLRDFEIWKQAVRLLAANGWRDGPHNRVAQARVQAQLGQFRHDLITQRGFRAPDDELPKSDKPDYEEVPLFEL